MKLKKGDQVVVISGKDRGKRGTIVRVFPEAERVLVEGVNVVKRHRKRKSEREKGERIEMSAPIHVSNVLLVDPKTNEPTRIGYRIENGEKVRVAKKSDSLIK